MPRRGFCRTWLLSCGVVDAFLWLVDSTWLLSCDMVDVHRGNLDQGCTSLVSSWFSCDVAVGIAIVGKLGGGAGSSWFASWSVVCGGKRTEVQR